MIELANETADAKTSALVQHQCQTVILGGVGFHIVGGSGNAVISIFICFCQTLKTTGSMIKYTINRKYEARHNIILNLPYQYTSSSVAGKHLFLLIIATC